VSLLDYNLTDDGVPYVVLEFLDGEHLGARNRALQALAGRDDAHPVPVRRASSSPTSATSSTAISSRRTSSSRATASR